MNTNIIYLNELLFNGNKQNLNLIVGESKPTNAILNLKGYKHSMVQIIALSIAWNIKVEIENPSMVLDTYVFCAIINLLGGVAKIDNGKLIVDPSGIESYSIPPLLSNIIHGSLYLIPALLVRFGKVEFFGSGGCQIGDNGARPIKHILDVMKLFGAQIVEENEKILCSLEKINKIEEMDIMQFSTNKKYLEGPLVGGATKVAILFSKFQKKFLIKNAYIKTDVMDVIRFVKNLDGNVTIEDGNISICNLNNLDKEKKVKFKLTECISEIITYCTFAVINDISIEFKDLNKETICKTLSPEFKLFDEMGVNYSWKNNNLLIASSSMLNACNIDVVPNSIQSDHQPFFALMLALKSKGISTITERVWKKRFQYINNLNILGANINLEDNKITIYPSTLNSDYKELYGNDVRTSAVTLLGIVKSQSMSKIKNCEHILRGYDSLIKNFKLLGVNLSIEKEL